MLADLGIKVGVFVDRKRTEQELRDTKARLIEEQRLGEVARVLGDIGHDLKNLLMPITGGAELLEEELSECFGTIFVPSPVPPTLRLIALYEKRLSRTSGDMPLPGSIG